MIADAEESATLAAEEEEEEEKESSTASDSGCESDDSTSLESDAPMIALGRACLGFCIELLNQRIHNREYDMALVCGMAVSGVAPGQRLWRAGEQAHSLWTTCPASPIREQRPFCLPWQTLRRD